MLKVGLTGSIAVGKSFVLNTLHEFGCRVLDADQTARDVVAPGTPGLKQIVENFGSNILLPDGSLNRAMMASIVFQDQDKLLLLNSIVHPLVFEAQADWLAEGDSDSEKKISVIDAALMIESGGYKKFDKIIVVWCEPELQLQRLMKRDGIDQEAAIRRIRAQMPQEEKKKYADYLIDTSNGFDDTRQQIEQVFAKLLKQ